MDCWWGSQFLRADVCLKLTPALKMPVPVLVSHWSYILYMLAAAPQATGGEPQTGCNKTLKG